MASSRKKQDEKNLKTIRELGALPQNKYCFDCNQRGPTYVNVTIGSFVCTKCSGMLRGITPPHRVKSISMATFTADEVDLLRSRGNAYCRKVWLGLRDSATPPSGHETAVKDFMVEKYERKRYYLDPVHVTGETRVESKLVKINGGHIQSTQRSRPEANRNNLMNGNNFAVNFEGPALNDSSNNNSEAQVQNGFANFDDNPVFSNTMGGGTTITGLPSPACFKNRNWSILQNTTATAQNDTVAASTEDKYAALKDLDNELKSQKNGHVDWGSTGSNGSLYSSPTPTGSVYSSPSPQGSIFGSPSQSQFLTAFPSTQEPHAPSISNPFGCNGIASHTWAHLNGNSNGQQLHQGCSNPFRDAVKSKGFAQVFQPIAAYPVNGTSGTNGWTQNPFMVGGTNSNSNNPFL